MLPVCSEACIGSKYSLNILNGTLDNKAFLSYINR